MSFGNAFLNGLNSGRREKQRLADEARTQQNFDNRQAGLADLQSEFGDRAFTPTEFGQLQGIDQRAELFPGQLEQQGLQTVAQRLKNQRAEGLIDDATYTRHLGTAANGLRLFNSVVNKAAAGGQDPIEALQGTINSMSPKARSLYGLDNVSTVQGMLMSAQENPGFFKEQLEAIVPPQAVTGSQAAPKQFEGAVTLSDGSTQRAAIIRNNDGSIEVVGGLPEGVTVSGFRPDRPFAPQRAGSTITQGVGGGEGIEVVGDVAGGLERGAQATARGKTVGSFEGSTITKDMPLSQTDSNSIARLLVNGQADTDLMVDTIDGLIDETDWGSSGTLQGLKKIDGTRATNVAQTLSVVQSDAILTKLVEIKATGATLGQVTEKELKLLQSSIVALEQSQTPEQLRKNLGTYRDRRIRLADTMAQDYAADRERFRVKEPTNVTDPIKQQGGLDALDAWVNQ